MIKKDSSAKCRYLDLFAGTGCWRCDGFLILGGCRGS